MAAFLSVAGALRLRNANGPIVDVVPVGVVQARAHDTSRFRSMDELAVSDIDAGMHGAPVDAEKDDVAGLQVGTRNPVPNLYQFLRTARDIQAQSLAIDNVNEAGTVDALMTVAAILIGSALPLPELRQ